MVGAGTFEARMKSYLHYCRTEKNLSTNTLESYRRDLTRFASFVGARGLSELSLEDLELTPIC